MELFDVMTQNPFWDGFAPADLGIISRFAHLRSVPAGSPIFVAKMHGESGFFLAAGTIDFLLQRHGHEILLSSCESPSFFGTRRLVTPGPRRLTARARTNAVVAEVFHTGLVQLHSEDPNLYLRIVDRAHWWHAKHTEDFVERFTAET